MVQILSDSRVTTNSSQNIVVPHSSNTNAAPNTNLNHNQPDAEPFAMEGGTIRIAQNELKSDEHQKCNSSKHLSPNSASSTQCLLPSSNDSMPEVNGSNECQSAIRTLRTSNSDTTLSKDSSSPQGPHDGNHRPPTFNQSEDHNERNTTTSPVAVQNSHNYNRTESFNSHALFGTSQTGRVLRTNDSHPQSTSAVGPTTTVHVTPSTSVLLDSAIPTYPLNQPPYITSVLTPQSIRLNQYSSMRNYPPSDNIDDAPARFIHSNSPLVSSAPIPSRSYAAQSVCDSTAPEKRGQKRRLPYTEKEGRSNNQSVSTLQNTNNPISSSIRVATSSADSAPSYNNDIFRENGTFEDSYSIESRVSHSQRDETRYETWTSKQLRKKCSHLKLRGLKNVKKHVMVDALYRYYRNLRHQEATLDTPSEQNGRNETSKGNGSPHYRQPQQLDSEAKARESLRYYYKALEELRAEGSLRSGRDDNTNIASNKSLSTLSQPIRGSQSSVMHDDLPSNTGKKESLVVTSEDVILLVDVVLSIEFVDRLASELSRWKFWVDVREQYVARSQSLISRNFDSRGPNRSNASTGDRSEDHTNYKNSSTAISARNWSSMQLWAMWKELTQVYSKACFAFTAAGK